MVVCNFNISGSVFSVVYSTQFLKCELLLILLVFRNGVGQALYSLVSLL